MCSHCISFMASPEYGQKLKHIQQKHGIKKKSAALRYCIDQTFSLPSNVANTTKNEENTTKETDHDLENA